MRWEAAKGSWSAARAICCPHPGQNVCRDVSAKIGGLDICIADALPVAFCQHLQNVMCCMRSLCFCHTPIVLQTSAHQSALAAAVALNNVC